MGIAVMINLNKKIELFDILAWLDDRAYDDLDCGCLNYIGEGQTRSVESKIQVWLSKLQGREISDTFYYIVPQKNTMISYTWRCCNLVLHTLSYLA